MKPYVVTINVDAREQQETRVKIPQGEARTFQVAFTSGGAAADLEDMTAQYLYKTPELSDWWTIPATVNEETGVVSFSWDSTRDPGALSYVGWLHLSHATGGPVYRLRMDIGMLETPGFTPNASELALAPIDFATLKYINEPWATPAEVETAVGNHNASAAAHGGVEAAFAGHATTHPAPTTRDARNATAAQGTTADNALPKAGGTMTGGLAMDGNAIEGASSVEAVGEDLSVMIVSGISETNPNRPGINQTYVWNSGFGYFEGVTEPRWALVYPGVAWHLIDDLADWDSIIATAGEEEYPHLAEWPEGTVTAGEKSATLTSEGVKDEGGQHISIPRVGGQYVVVPEAADNAARGAALLAVYDAQPDDIAGPADARTILLPPGTYDLGSTGITLDKPYINLVALVPAKVSGAGTAAMVLEPTVTLTADTGATGGTVQQTADNVLISDIEIKNTSDENPYGHDNMDPAAYWPDSGVTGTVLRRVKIAGGADDLGGDAWATRITSYAQAVEECLIVGDYSIGGIGGTVSGTITTSTITGISSVGGSAGSTISCAITNTTITGDFSVGGAGGTVSAAARLYNVEVSGTDALSASTVHADAEFHGVRGVPAALLALGGKYYGVTLTDGTIYSTPAVSVGNATADGHALNRTTADGRYSRLRASTQYAAGNVSGAVALDANNGALQTIVVTDDVTNITVSNLAGQPVMVHVDNSADKSIAVTHEGAKFQQGGIPSGASRFVINFYRVGSDDYATFGGAYEDKTP